MPKHRLPADSKNKPRSPPNPKGLKWLKLETSYFVNNITKFIKIKQNNNGNIRNSYSKIPKHPKTPNPKLDPLGPKKAIFSLFKNYNKIFVKIYKKNT